MPFCVMEATSGVGPSRESLLTQLSITMAKFNAQMVREVAMKASGVKLARRRFIRPGH